MAEMMKYQLRDYPIQLEILNEEATHLQEIVLSCGFHELKKEDGHEKPERLLRIRKAGHRTQMEIHGHRAEDKYGDESISPRHGYQLYRLKDYGAMIFSLGVSEWELGVNNIDLENAWAFRTMVNRFVCFAVASHGVIGLFGHTKEDCHILTSPQACDGNLTLFDLRARVIISAGEEREWREENFFLYRLDKTHVGNPRALSREEALSFLTFNNGFLTLQQNPVTLQQALITMIKFTSVFKVHHEYFETLSSGPAKSTL